jgi:hypothetical protein
MVVQSSVPPAKRRPPQPDFFMLGLQVSTNTDDNALYDNANRHSRIFTRIEPRFTCNFSQPRLKWTVDYRPGLNMDYGVSTYTSVSHLLEAKLDYSLTKRLRVNLRTSFLESKDPFDRLRESRLSQGGQFQDPRADSFIAQATRTTSGQAALELSYALGPHSTLGVSGSFLRAKYNALAGPGQQAASELENASTIGGRAFYSHHLTRAQWTGFEYNVQNLTSRAARSQHLVQSLLYSHTLGFAPNQTLTVLAGPERSAMHHSPGVFLDASTRSQSEQWGWASVATYKWTGPLTSVIAGWSHRISDGGLLGPVRLSGGTAELRQKFAPKWRADFLVGYNRSRTLAIGPGTFSYASAAAGITRALNQSLFLELRYWRVHQTASSAPAAAYLGDHNRISASLTYDLNNRLRRGSQ